MDPNATLREIDSFLQDRRTGEEVDDWCGYLYEWLQKGGFAPDWEKYPTGTSYYNCYVSQLERAMCG